MRLVFILLACGLWAAEAPKVSQSNLLEFGNVEIGGTGSAAPLRIMFAGEVYLHGKLVGKLTAPEAKMMQRALTPSNSAPAYAPPQCPGINTTPRREVKI